MNTVSRIKIKPEDLAPFKNWLESIGYKKKSLQDGGCTFKGRGTHLRYVVIARDRGGNNVCRSLYEEYQEHIRS